MFLFVYYFVCNQLVTKHCTAIAFTTGYNSPFRGAKVRSFCETTIKNAPQFLSDVKVLRKINLARMDFTTLVVFRRMKRISQKTHCKTEIP